MNPAPDLTAWLNACLDEHERIAREATPGPWLVGTERDHLVDHVIYGQSTAWSGRIAQVCSVELGQNQVGHTDAEHIALHDPVAVLADIAAKRRIIDRVLEDAAIAADPLRSQRCTDTEWQLVTMARDVLRALASAYAHRDGYMSEEWSLGPS